MSKQERFVVTGGAGLIGCNLVQELNRRGHTDIIIADHLNHPAKERNLAGLQYREFMDKNEFREKFLAGRIEVPVTVFHLGACSSTTETDADYLNDNNLRYTQQLCQWALDNGSRFIYASSAATYGDGELGYSDSDELTPQLKPLNLYGKSKQDFDIWAMQQGLLDKIAGLKYFNVYGPHEDHKGNMRSLVNKAFYQIQETGRLKLFKSHKPGWDDGKQERDFVYVRDAVAVTLFFHDNPDKSGIFNCGTGIARTWLDLANAVFAAMEREPQIDFIDMPESIRDKYQYHTRAETAKLRAAGYTAPFTSIEDGVADYIRNYLNSLA